MIQLGHVDRQTECLQERLHPGGERGIHAAKPFRQPGGADHADGHRVAVQQLAVAGKRLEGVAERMAEVQHGPQPALLAFVLFDHAGFQPAAAGDHRNQHAVVALAQGGRVVLKIAEELGVENHAVLDHFRQAGAVLVGGQGGQAVRVDQHAQRLQERTDHVLRFGQVDAHLAAHRAIDLGQQRRGDLKETKPAGVGGGHESGDVADDSAADGRHDRLAVRAQIEQALPQSRHQPHRLALLAGIDGDDVNLDVLSAEAFGRLHGVGLHVVVGDEHHVRHFGPIGEKAARLGQIARADLDIVAALAKVDADGFDRAARAHIVLLRRSRSAAVTVILRMKPTGRRTYSNSAARAGSACSRAASGSRSDASRGPLGKSSGQTVCFSTTSASR